MQSRNLPVVERHWEISSLSGTKIVIKGWIDLSIEWEKQREKQNKMDP